MIRIIGPKLILIILLLLFFNASLFGSWFFWSTPMKEQAEMNLNGINAEISKLRSSIYDIKDELKYYDDNKDNFASLVDDGYMKEQSRFSIAEVLEKMRKSSHVQKLSYDISDMAELEHDKAEKAKHRLVKRRIELKDINGFFDTDVYKFIYSLNSEFPGHTRVVSVDISRDPLSKFEGIIETISSGKQGSFISGSIDIDWYALVKLPDVENVPTTPIR